MKLWLNCLNKLHTNSYSDYALQFPRNKVTVLYIAHRHLHLHLVKVLMVRIKCKSSCFRRWDQLSPQS